ncbi:MAG: family 16 glycosylhydrolase [Cyclobacteriaceae bacterium]|nr:family 16 glycosylhydrolase [Cyclobacteriaceae bacterium]
MMLRQLHKTLLPVCIALMLTISACEDDSTDNSLVTFTLRENSFTESNSNQTRTLTIVASRPLGKNDVVNYTITERTARFNDDVTFTATSGTLDFSTNSTEARLDFNLIGDTHPELPERFNLLVSFKSSTFDLAVTIQDNDTVLPEQIQTDAEGFVTPVNHPSMTMVWADEFEGTVLNASSWTYEIGNGCDVGICGWGNNELQRYTNSSDNSKLENGRLVITARKEGATNYTSARIKTQEKRVFTHGRVDVRARLPKGQGIWPAIWMLGTNITTVSWPNCGEIDIMELVGHQPKVVHGTVHFFDGSYKFSSSSTSLSTGDFSDQFHVFTIMWDFNKIEFFVDNKLYKTFTNAGIQNYPFNNPFFFIMNIAVGGNWPGSPDDTTVFPQEMVVDYIRVFQ